MFGFFQSTFTAPEQGQGYAIPVGYLKRPEAGVVALVFTVNQELLGTTSKFRSTTSLQFNNVQLEKLLLEVGMGAPKRNPL